MSTAETAEPEGGRGAATLWSLAVVGASAVVALLVGAPSAGPWWGPSSLLAGFLVCWFAFGVGAVLPEGRGHPLRRALLVAAVVLAALGGTLLDPAFAAFQLIGYPLVWSSVRRLRTAIAVNVLLAAAVAVGYAVTTVDLPQALTVQAISLGFSLVMGTWISYYADLSEQRRDLIGRLTTAQDEVAALNRERGTAAERERLSRELHDTIAQSLTGVVMLAERARRRHPGDDTLVVLEDCAREALTETRGLVAATAPVPVEGGLAAALARLGERFERETGVRVRTAVTATAPRGSEVVLLRCAQEGLANVRKHARATTATVRVEQAGDDVLLRVEDDGVGPGAPRDGGFGLSGMRDRVALVGGGLALEPGELGGALLSVRVPLGASTVAGAEP